MFAEPNRNRRVSNYLQAYQHGGQAQAASSPSERLIAFLLHDVFQERTKRRLCSLPGCLYICLPVLPGCLYICLPVQEVERGSFVMFLVHASDFKERMF